jgi:lyso-ornithine lipid O-acyltransferase
MRDSLLDRPSDAGWHFATRVRVIRRGLSILLWTIPFIIIQAVCLLLRGRAKTAFARAYWVVFCRLLGLNVRVIGSVRGAEPGRPTLFISNHCSWIDIPVIGSVIEGSFVAKSDVADWPVVRTIARLGRTVFVSRQRGSTGRERDAMRARLAAGDNLILFPEGTSSDGSRVLPFRSAFFAIASPAGEQPNPLIQPVSIVYDRVGGLPAGRASRPIFAWYGDMDIASHFWRLGQYSGLRASVLLHATIDPTLFADRKALSQAVWTTVADGAATLRQNRPAHPLGQSEPDPLPDLAAGQPAFA